MEYYEKSQTKRYASTPLGNEIRITSHGRVRVLVSRVLDKIKVSVDFKSDQSSVHVDGAVVLNTPYRKKDCRL